MSIDATTVPNLELGFRDAVPSPQLRAAASAGVTTCVEAAERRARESAAGGDELVLDTADLARPAVEDGPGVLVPVPPSGWMESIQVGPPYDFDWQWHTGGNPYSVVLERPSGHAGVDARSGSATGGVDGAVSAHAGFGLYRVLGVGMPVTAWATLTVRWHYTTGCAGLGSFALAEGGYELTALTDGQLLTSASTKLFRRRVSVHEQDTRDGGFQTVKTGPISFYMAQGVGYTFNLGLWATTDKSQGVGGNAAAQGLVEATVTELAILGYTAHL